MRFGSTGGIPPTDMQMLRADLEGKMAAVNRYSAHMTAAQNPWLQQLWGRIRMDEMRHAHWLQMAMAGYIPGAMGQVGGMGAGIAPAYQMGQVVVPTHAHMPEHVDRAARVVGIVQNQPFYIVDFGDGHPHRWYAQEELQPAPPGTRPGQHVPGSTSGEGHS